MARRRERQLTIEFRTWGGRRPGAGRPRAPGAKLRHGAREPLAARHPVHVTLRARPGSPNLRRTSVFSVVEEAIRRASERADFRIVHFSAQSNHLHLVVEARGAAALSRGMQAFAIRVARGVNRAAGRAGKLWADRYHSRPLRSPREVRAALCYVLQNTRRHATNERERAEPGWIDPRSSGRWFDGWRGARSDVSPAASPPGSSARTWLLSTGWRRCGLIGIDEVPAAAGDH